MSFQLWVMTRACHIGDTASSRLASFLPASPSLPLSLSRRFFPTRRREKENTTLKPPSILIFFLSQLRRRQQQTKKESEKGARILFLAPGIVNEPAKAHCVRPTELVGKRRWLDAKGSEPFLLPSIFFCFFYPCLSYADPRARHVLEACFHCCTRAPETVRAGRPSPFIIRALFVARCCSRLGSLVSFDLHPAWCSRSISESGCG